jgi:hypothetical protein
MSFLLQLDDARFGEQLIPILERLEAETAKAEPLFLLNGRRLEEIARELPQHQAYYMQLAQEARHLVKWLENHLEKIEARLTNNYLKGQRAYGARETTVLIAGSSEMVEHKQLIIEASLTHQKLDAIVEGFKQMGWMLGNVTKLRVAELQDVIL